MPPPPPPPRDDRRGGGRGAAAGTSARGVPWPAGAMARIRPPWPGPGRMAWIRPEEPPAAAMVGPARRRRSERMRRPWRGGGRRRGGPGVAPPRRPLSTRPSPGAPRCRPALPLPAPENKLAAEAPAPGPTTPATPAHHDALGPSGTADIVRWS
ncbi:hypothetical protein BS78_K145100 [Paspalum vaginatum]|uniref:Uncharacterized protein n=1 Tax=Paspalum vaginatum TaxID=158149 RepID=A0A9W7X7S4_9POAL|nr:hypothetical protein BS78_K145100 [Paspalum vaginatum]